MQNDYCKGCNSATESPWSTDALLKISSNINRAIKLTKDGSDESVWDLIVYTKDSLKPGRVCVGNQRNADKTCIKGSSLVSGTYGNDVIRALHAPDNIPYIEFTKNNDDWMNEIDQDYRGNRAYSIEGEYLPGIVHPTLHQLLDFRSFHPEKTNLVVTGV